MDADTTYSLGLSILNFKSYYGEEVLIKFDKPITVIAGPNGEGKSNLLEALVLSIYQFLNRTRKFDESSLFKRTVVISTQPIVKGSYSQLISEDLIKKALSQKSSAITFPDRLHPNRVLSHGKNDGWFQFGVSRIRNKRAKILAQNYSEFGTSHNGYTNPKSEYINDIDYLDLIYITPDSYILDFFVNLLSHEWQLQEGDIHGRLKGAKFTDNILSLFPSIDDRMIQDIDPKGFQETYAKDTDLFLTYNLATSAKKEGLLYLLGLINERTRKYKDWMFIIVIDEFESGLHVLREKLLVDAILNIFKVFPNLQNHIRIVLSTHSPIIYSELGKEPDLVDVLFVLRDPNTPTHVYRANDEVEKHLVEKRISSELGLNIYEIPAKILFVEGKTDIAFFRNVFSGIQMFELEGSKIPKLVRQLIAKVPLARDKTYHVLLDKGKLEEIKTQIERIKRDYPEIDKRIKPFVHNYKTIEEFILGVPRDMYPNPRATWNKTLSRINDINERLSDLCGKTLTINATQIKNSLYKQGKEGLIKLYDSLKKHEDFYELCGKYWRQILNDEEIDFIKTYAKMTQMKLVP